jgi:ABC-2 type transport system ATP-binding protein
MEKLMNAIEVNDVTKIYPDSGGTKVTALDDLSIAVEEGSIFGLLGANGAGKTTLIKALLGMISVNSGELKILGENVPNIKIHKEIGYLPENHKFPNYLKGIEALYFFGELSGMRKKDLDEPIKYYLDRFKLQKASKRKIKTYSKGMMQRLGLIQAVIHNPKVIFLDEPTDGVDPIGRKEIRDFIFELKKEGKTIFINSHLLSEVEMICDKVAILDKGKLVKTGTINDLLENDNSFFIDIDNEAEKLYSIPDLNSFEYKLEGNKIILKNSDYETLNKLIDILRVNGVMVKGSGALKVSLEEFFIDTIDKNEGNDE